MVHAAVSGAAHSAIDGIVRAHSPTGAVPALGRSERLDAYAAALASGAAAHLGGDDDTGAACPAAGLSLGWLQHSTGRRFVHATALGVEVQLRVGQALPATDADEGWHVTATCGVIGATITAGLLAELDDAELVRAIGLAVSQTAGRVERSGSAASAMGVGKAAANGLLAVLLARTGVTAPDTALDGDRGLFAVLAPRAQPACVLAGLGSEWHLLRAPERAPVCRGDRVAAAVRDLPEAPTLQSLVDAAIPQGAAHDPHGGPVRLRP
nr:putative dehydratase [uncultured bacterium]